MRLAIIGDMAGHKRELSEELVRLGMDPDSLRLPDDLIVCQLGDLVHRGPDSPGIIELVDQLMVANPNRWKQLIGNHEAQYIFDPPRFDFPENLDRRTQRTLRRWWRSGAMQVAAAFETGGVDKIRPGGHIERLGTGGLLVTHSGLTAGAWHQLGKPQTAHLAAAAINDERNRLGSVVWRAGLMLGGPVDRATGCVWAEACKEVYDSWAREACHPPNFNQVHGHTSAMWWSQGKLSEVPTPGVSLTVDYSCRQVLAEINGQAIWGIDPGHGKHPATPWSALVFEDVRQ
jgi:hypothetical protein